MIRYTKNNHRFIQAILHYHTDSVIIVDPAGIIQYRNDTMRPILGWKPQEVIGTCFLDYVHEQDREYFQAHLNQVLQQKEPITIIYRAKTKSEAYKWLESDVIHLLDSDQIQGLVIRSRDITEKMEVEAREKAHKADYESLFFNHPDAVTRWNTAGITEDVNASAERLFGYSKQEMLGRHFLCLLEPLDAATAQQAFAHTLQGQPGSFLGQAYHKNGCRLQTNTTLIPVLLAGRVAGIQAITQDITGILAAQQELEKLSHVVNKINNGVLILNQQGSIEWSNQSLNDFTGYTLAETLRHKAGDLLLDGAETGEATMARIKDNVAQGIAFSEDVVLRNKNGEKRWFTGQATPVAGSTPAENKTYVILTDISQRKEAEEKLQLQAEELYRQNRDLQQFTYIVSHNLRAPVANALGLASLLRGLSKEAPVFDEIMEKLNQTVNRLDTVIKDLNTILTIRDKNQSGDKQAVLVGEVCRQVKAGLQQSLQEAQAQLELALDDGATLDANKAFLYSIFYNLVNNAIKYRDANRRLRIEIASYHTPEGQLAVSVTDNGLGMNMDRVGKDIFKLYKRFHSSIEGKGMGLFMVKTQMEALGGRISVDSLPGRGTTFTLYFPAYDKKITTH